MTTHIQYTQEQVEVMLSHFMDGTSSLEEEAMLANYFRTHDVKDEWKEYKEMFAMFDAERVEVDDAPHMETAPLADVPKRVELKPKVLLYRSLAIAASIAVVVTISIMLNGHDQVAEQVAENDTTNIVQEIERVVYDSPKHQMADNAEQQVVQPVVQRVKVHNIPKAIAKAEINDTVATVNEANVDSMVIEHHDARQYRRMPQDYMAEMDMDRIINDVKARGEKIRHEVEVACSPNLY